MEAEHTRAAGRWAEARVAEAADARGLVVVARNVDLGLAELDIVARTRGRSPTIVFIEVRSRTERSRGTPAETVDARKRRQIERGATLWLVQHELWERCAVRFDVVCLSGPRHAPLLEWFEHAWLCGE